MIKEINHLKSIYEIFFKTCSDENRCKHKELSEKYINKYINSYSLNITKGYFSNSNRILLIGQEKRDVKQNDFMIYDKNSIPHPSPKDKHWIGTLMSVIKFCHKDLTKNQLDNIEKMALFDDFDIEFAFTNYYKCAFTDSKNWTNMYHSKDMCNNCCKLLIDEINELRPSLIIKQGKFGKDFFNNNYILEEIYLDENMKKNKQYIMHLYKSHYSNDEIFYIIDAYHPCCKCYNWYNHKESLYKLIDKYYECINNNN